jgi:hypothetical protein
MVMVVMMVMMMVMMMMMMMINASVKLISIYYIYMTPYLR